ncbi:MAG: cbb3-type cytochrome c oxidase subunit II [Tepidisphaerales bacterium]
MKNGSLFFAGLFVALVLSWAGLALGTQAQLGNLAPHYDDLEGAAYPQRISGLAGQGQLVYRDLGCASCHTQQVRRPEFGSDKERGWGDRQSVARDYVYQTAPMLGSSRIGPDLANFGARAEKNNQSAAALLASLYNGAKGMPSYRFLFEVRKIVGQRANNALAGGAPAGYELVPTGRAEALVAYLLSLKQPYEFPEARPFVPASSQEGAHE